MRAHYDTPEPGAAEMDAEYAEQFERGKQDYKDSLDRAERATFDGAERDLMLSLVSQYVVDTGRLLRSGQLPAGKAVLLRSDMARAEGIARKLRGDA